MVHEVTSLTILQSILLSGITVGFYTILGGIEAVIWTDVIQTITLVFGGLICIGVIIYQLPEGLNQIIDIALLNNKLSFSELKDGVLHPVSWGVSLSNKTGIMMIFLGFSWFFQEYITNQNIIQRYAATKNESEARKAMFISSINIPIWAFFMFLGTALYAYFQVYPSEAASEMLIGTRNAEDILPYFIIYYLPAGISGLIIAAAIAAAMSSLDSSINSISTVSVHDIYRRHLAPNKDDIHYLHIAWYIATFATAIMIIGSCILAFSKMITLQDTYNTIGSVVMGGVLGLYLLGFCTKRGSEKSVWFGIALTMMFSLWTVLAKYSFLPDWLQAPFDLYYTGILGQMIMFAGIFVAAVLFSDSKNNLKNLTIWTKGNK
jgi:SSS family solute:Na+ symporter